MQRMKPVTEGTWNRISKTDKHYRSIDGAEVRYDCNRFLWITHNNEAFSTLSVAQQVAAKNPPQGPVTWERAERFGRASVLVAR